MADTFALDRHRWLEAVAADTALAPHAFRAAYFIAGYMNRKTRTAWPSRTTLSTAMGISERSISLAVSWLMKAGHLHVVVAKAPGRSNEYAMAFKDGKQASHEHGKQASPNRRQSREAKRTITGSAAHEHGKPSVEITGSRLQPNLIDEPKEEPIDEPRERRARKKRHTSMPSHWPSEKDKGWMIEFWRKEGRDDLIPRVEAVAMACRDHHLGKGTLASDWSAVSRTWAQREIKFEKPPNGIDRPRTGAASAAVGIDAILGE